jgi:hypothetical protein
VADTNNRKRNTLLVLGAGASQPYQFLTGGELARKLCLTSIRAYGDPDELRRHGFDDRILDRFRDQYRRADMSIDEFLYLNPEWGELGKKLIAFHIGGCEHPDRLTAQTQGHWYRYLWGVLRQHWDNVPACCLRVLTFNYDRSLEMYLTDAAMAAFKIDAAAAMKAIEPLQITHVYGDLGQLGEMSPAYPTRPYGAVPIISGEMGISTSRLKLMTDRDLVGDDDPVRSAVTWATKICFLGFGYDPLNIKRLGLSKGGMGPDGKPKVCYGTMHMLARAERDKVKADLSTPGNVGGFDMDGKLDCEAYIRDSGILGVRVGIDE